MDQETTSEKSASLPDVSHETKAEFAAPIDQVGMSRIEMPVKFAGLKVPARIEAFVSLDQVAAKGIHMSRLYSRLRDSLAQEEMSLGLLHKLLDQFVVGQNGLSEKSYIKVAFEMPVERQALLSGEKGWRQYPVVFAARRLGETYQYELGFDVSYSSTCPCSAALARQAVQEHFLKSFLGRENIGLDEVHEWLGEAENIQAVPHAQRSLAQARVRWDEPGKAPSVLALIDLFEQALQTPVQTAVKRQDEQEFARRNGQNLMFCEDAVRRLKRCLEEAADVADYWVRVDHFESLHPHNATAVVVKGVEGGFQVD